VKLSTRSEIENSGFGITGEIDGIIKKTYYTPDGREMRLIPQIRTWVKKDAQGKEIATGVRDANLDKGWLLQKPAVLKPFCKGCSQWHDTEAEVKACIKKQNTFIKQAELKAKKEEVDKESALEKKVAELEGMIKKLMETKQNG
jgi:hypothetical protein